MAWRNVALAVADSTQKAKAHASQRGLSNSLCGGRLAVDREASPTSKRGSESRPPLLSPGEQGPIPAWGTFKEAGQAALAGRLPLVTTPQGLCPWTVVCPPASYHGGAVPGLPGSRHRERPSPS